MMRRLGHQLLNKARSSKILLLTNSRNSVVAATLSGTCNEGHEQLLMGCGKRGFHCSLSQWNDKVTITHSAASQEATRQVDDPKGSGGGCCGGSIVKEKSKDQIADEYTLELQNLIRQLHHTAEYEKGLEASLELLRHCEGHFEHPLLGKAHPVTASAHNNVALMYKCLGQFQEATTHYQQSMEMYRQTLGDDHANTATAMANLANLLRARVNYQEDMNVRQRRELLVEAVKLLEASLTIRTNELGHDHPHTVTGQSNLGATLAAQVLMETQVEPEDPLALEWTLEQHELAERHLRKAFEMSLQNQSKGKTAITQEKTGGSITTLSAASAAQSLAVYLKITADRLVKATNPMVSHTGSSAAIYSENPMELYEEAQRLYKGALEARKRILGSANPDTLASLSSLAELKTAVGDENGSLALRQEIIKIVEKAQLLEEKKLEEKPLPSR